MIELFISRLYCVAFAPAEMGCVRIYSCTCDARMRISTQFGRVHKSNLFECASFVVLFYCRYGVPVGTRGPRARRAGGEKRCKQVAPCAAAAVCCHRHPPARLTARALIALLFNQTQTRLCQGWSKTSSLLSLQMLNSVN